MEQLYDNSNVYKELCFNHNVIQFTKIRKFRHANFKLIYAITSTKQANAPIH